MTSVSENIERELEGKSLSELLIKKLTLPDYEFILDIISSEKYRLYLSENCLEVVPVVTKLFSKGDCDDEKEEYIAKVLFSIAENGNPKESLMAFLENISTVSNVQHFKVLLRCIQHVLLVKMENHHKRSFISWAFNGLHSYVVNHRPKHEGSLSYKEVMLLDSEPQYQFIYGIMKSLHHFYSSFHLRILNNELEWIGCTNSTRDNFAFYLLRYLNEPFAYLDVYNDGKNSPSVAYDICTNFVKVINSLLLNPLKVLQYVKIHHYEDNTENFDEDHQDFAKREDTSNLISSIGVYMYCLYNQKMEDNFPCVYSPIYIYLKCTICCLHLFNKQEDLPIQKGLLLMSTMMEHLSNEILPKGIFDHRDVLETPKILSLIMRWSKNEELRLLALQVFKKFLKKFNGEASLYLISLLLGFDFSSFVAIVIHELKEKIARDLRRNNRESCFLGKKSKDVLLLACSLPDFQNKQSILDWNDRIMGSLNFILFLLLSNKEKVSVFYEILPTVQRDFLEPLKEKIYDEKTGLQFCLYGKEVPKSQQQSSTFDIPVNHYEGMRAGYTWLDMMENVRARIDIVIHEKTQSGT